MNIIKKYRKSMKLDQARFAEIIRMPVDELSKLERKIGEIEAPVLRDIANSLYTTVSEMSHPYPGSDSGFWGHIGVRLLGKSLSEWHAISVSEANRFASNSVTSDWVFVETLDNKALLINLSEVEQVIILDDDYDQIPDDWSISPEQYSGFSPEFYRCVDEYICDELDPGVNVSQKLFEKVEEYVKSLPCDGDEFECTKIHFKSGNVISASVEGPSIYEAIFEVELGIDFAAKRFDLKEFGGANRLISLSQVSMIEFPMHLYKNYADSILE